jgi:hypothetical protein
MSSNSSHQLRLISETGSEYKISTEEQARKDEYRQRLRECLHDPEFRKIPGFPIGDDDAILELSDPPYYTACPNPFLTEIIDGWVKERIEKRNELGLPDDGETNRDGYHREPFAADVSEGKNNPIYNAHSYHTKVPHPAIMRYILHYTDPGDIVFDGFCGTGMTGVAAQLCDDRPEVEELGYYVDQEGLIYEKLGDKEPISKLGSRKAVLSDLSPVATFITHNYNTPVDINAYEHEAQRILEEVETECGWMYETWHPHCDDLNRVKGKIKYVIWSDVFICPDCNQELVYWDIALDRTTGAIKEEFSCSGCSSQLSKRRIERVWESKFDNYLNKSIRVAKQLPVVINYSIDRKNYEKIVDTEDLALIQQINNSIVVF